MTDFGIEIGDTTTFTKTIGESDVYQFAGITGDFSPNHVNEEFMRNTVYGHRIAHGVLILGLASTTSTLMVEKSYEIQDRLVSFSQGYDRVRFLRGVVLGDIITVRYEITELDPSRMRTVGEIEASNQHGDLVMVAEHIMKWLEREA